VVGEGEGPAGDHTVYDHSSIPASVRARFAPGVAVDAFGQRAAQAATFPAAAVTAVEPRTDDLPDLTVYSERFAATLPTPAPAGGGGAPADGPLYVPPDLQRSVPEHLKCLYLTGQAMGRVVDDAEGFADKATDAGWHPTLDMVALHARQLLSRPGLLAPAPKLTRGRERLDADS